MLTHEREVEMNDWELGILAKAKHSEWRDEARRDRLAREAQGEEGARNVGRASTLLLVMVLLGAFVWLVH
jgi:hypothetical protein